MADQDRKIVPADEELLRQVDEERTRRGEILSRETREQTVSEAGRGGSFYLTKDEHEAMIAKRSEERLVGRIARSGVSHRFTSLRYTFDTFPCHHDDDRQAIAEVRAWLGAAGRAKFNAPIDNCGLFICGPVGTGKSGLAECAVMSMLPFMEALFCNRVELIQHIHDAQRDTSGTSELEAAQRYMKTPLLAIDDIDKGTVTPSVLKLLWLIIDRRYRDESLTIFTSNADYEELFDVLNIAGSGSHADAIVDRIRAMCRPITLRGSSKR